MKIQNEDGSKGVIVKVIDDDALLDGLTQMVDVVLDSRAIESRLAEKSLWPTAPSGRGRINDVPLSDSEYLHRQRHLTLLRMHLPIHPEAAPREYRQQYNNASLTLKVRLKRLDRVIAERKEKLLGSRQRPIRSSGESEIVPRYF